MKEIKMAVSLLENKLINELQEKYKRKRAVYNALGSLTKELVFVGRATVSFYAEFSPLSSRDTPKTVKFLSLYLL